MFAYQDDAYLSPHNLIKTGGANLDAIDGFADLVRNLDQHGLGEARGVRWDSMLPIVLGWIVLALVIYYPATQLAAISATVVFIGCRALLRSAASAGGWLVDRQNEAFIGQDFRPIMN